MRGLPTAAVHLGHSRGDRAHVCTFALINSPRADGYAPMRAPVAALVNGGAAAAPSAMQHPAAAVVKPVASRNAGGAVGVASPGNAQGKARVQAAAAPPPPPPPPHHHVGAGVSAPTNDPSGPDPLAVRALLPRPAWACAWCEARRVFCTCTIRATRVAESSPEPTMRACGALVQVELHRMRLSLGEISRERDAP